MFPFSANILTRRWPVVTFLIVAINVMSLLWLDGLSPQQQAYVTAKWGFVPARVEQLSDPNKVIDVEVGAPHSTVGMDVGESTAGGSDAGAAAADSYVGGDMHVFARRLDALDWEHVVFAGVRQQH